jgi:hypothetical protein
MSAAFRLLSFTFRSELLSSGPLEEVERGGRVSDPSDSLLFSARCVDTVREHVPSTTTGGSSCRTVTRRILVVTAMNSLLVLLAMLAALTLLGHGRVHQAFLPILLPLGQIP